ncbi:hypothetical protein [Streptomyces sp. NBC_01477]|uniref:hypothetical protein n=1 Tax=Streptomyces sp. NBC_01477 TaxID=2976015 RepID=UPI002E35AC35|nr:hypothetical protein [Streptomyces sp. NBC_01477]
MKRRLDVTGITAQYPVAVSVRMPLRGVKAPGVSGWAVHCGAHAAAVPTVQVSTCAAIGALP